MEKTWTHPKVRKKKKTQNIWTLKSYKNTYKYRIMIQFPHSTHEGLGDGKLVSLALSKWYEPIPSEVTPSTLSNNTPSPVNQEAMDQLKVEVNLSV